MTARIRKRQDVERKRQDMTREVLDNALITFVAISGVVVGISGTLIVQLLKLGG